MIETIAKIVLTILFILTLVLVIIAWKESRRLKRFRNNLKAGDRVIVDNGVIVQDAIVIAFRDNWVQVSLSSGNMAGYGLRCIYPINGYDYESATDRDL